jgi:hypothetical protein
MHQPACTRTGIACLARAGLCAGVFLAAATMSRADAPPENPSHEAYRDLQLMVHARKALSEQEGLVSINLGVRVRDGIATLWGPVPSADVISKAMKRLESVQGILGVRSELFVAIPEKEPEQLLFSIATPEPTQSESASPDPVSGMLSALTGRNIKSTGVFGPATTSGPAPGVDLARPESVNVPGAASARPRPPERDPRNIAPSPESLTLAVERLRHNDARFRTLRAEIRGTMVVIAGAADRDADVMTFARAVSRIPGVERVLTKTDAGPAP